MADNAHPVRRKAIFICCAIIVVLALGGAARRVIVMEQRKQNLPPAPEGYAWVRMDALSDEFTGTSLDTSKWQPVHPYWAGREPSQFNPYNVAQDEGLLLLGSTPMIKTMDEVDNPEKDNWVHSACVSSLDPLAFYGYYEARMKASNLSMTSSFWMQGKYSEIDIVEQIGNPLNNPTKASYMMMNTHYYPDGWESDVATPENALMSSGSAEEFHIYGVWWKDANTLWMYLDGEKVAEIETGGPFEEPMYIFFDTEVFTWEGLPSLESLNDAEARVMQVDWVRSWQLVEK